MSRMSSPRQRTSFTPGLRTFISKVITPTVLVGGVLLLIFFNFEGVLKASKISNNQFNGVVAFSQENFAYRFQENAGIDRPALRYAGQDLLSYAEWSSTASVDGDVQELWNNAHGYDSSDAKNQVYSTISGYGWQLIEIVTLVNDHTVTVTFNFDARPASAASGPTHYVFNIAHASTGSNVWYNYQTGNGTFTAQVVPGSSQPIAGQMHGFGKLTLVATGDASPTPSVSVQPGGKSVNGGSVSLYETRAFITKYTVDNPSPYRMITLGTETLTFQPNSGPIGAPLPGTVPLPGQ